MRIINGERRYFRNAASNFFRLVSLKKKTKEKTAGATVESLDDLKHMELPVQEFALGCSFLHQTALGNLSELQAMAKAQPSLVNFRDYDRRTPYVFLFCSGLR